MHDYVSGEAKFKNKPHTNQGSLTLRKKHVNYCVVGISLSSHLIEGSGLETPQKKAKREEKTTKWRES